MAEGEMIDYLPEKVADYRDIQFDFSPQLVMVEEGGLRQDNFEFDDTTRRTITHNTDGIFTLTLLWEAISADKANSIWDFYFNPSKAKGTARSFEFPHPKDGNTYVVKFKEGLRREFRYNRRYPEVVLSVIGYVGDSSSSA